MNYEIVLMLIVILTWKIDVLITVTCLKLSNFKHVDESSGRDVSTDRKQLFFECSLEIQ